MVSISISLLNLRLRVRIFFTLAQHVREASSIYWKSSIFENYWGQCFLLDYILIHWMHFRRLLQHSGQPRGSWFKARNSQMSSSFFKLLSLLIEVVPWSQSVKWLLTIVRYTYFVTWDSVVILIKRKLTHSTFGGSLNQVIISEIPWFAWSLWVIYNALGLNWRAFI